MYDVTIDVQLGVSKRVVDNYRLPALRSSDPRNICKAVSGLARLVGVEGSARVRLGVTLGSPWPHLAIRLWA
jgi:hypothetical protein